MRFFDLREEIGQFMEQKGGKQWWNYRVQNGCRTLYLWWILGL